MYNKHIFRFLSQQACCSDFRAAAVQMGDKEYLWAWVSRFSPQWICTSSCLFKIKLNVARGRRGCGGVSLWLTALVKGRISEGRTAALSCQGQPGGVWQESSWRFQLENWRYATQPVCQSCESRGQLSVTAMIGGIMGCGDSQEVYCRGRRRSGCVGAPRRGWYGRFGLTYNIVF